MTRPSTPTHTTGNDVTLITGSGRKPIWNYTEAAEPLSKSSPKTDMPTPAAKTRYAVLIAVMVGGALMLHGVPIQHVIAAGALGWALGQFLCWPAPR